jgi:hypothetical protein
MRISAVTSTTLDSGSRPLSEDAVAPRCDAAIPAMRHRPGQE